MGSDFKNKLNKYPSMENKGLQISGTFILEVRGWKVWEFLVYIIQGESSFTFKGLLKKVGVVPDSTKTEKVKL